MAVRGGAMPELGGILVDLERVLPKDVSGYLWELRDRLGPLISLHVLRAAEELVEAPEFVRWVKPARALAIASTRAVERGHLVVLLGPIMPDAAVIEELLRAFELDELVGFTEPRFSDAASDDIWFLPGGEPDAGRLPRQSLSLLPETYLTTEHLAGCVAIRREVIAAFRQDSERPENLAIALLHEMRSARRRGYRNLVMNRLVVASTESRATAYPLPEGPFQLDDVEQFPPGHYADDWFNGGIHRRRESLVAKACRPRPKERVPVLLDCRGMVAHHNGTSEAIFGLLDGLAGAKPDWDIDLLFNPGAAAYHRTASRFPAMRISTTLPGRPYAAAICLNQPWHLSTVKELHDRALAIAFNILDTIAWDVVYLSNPEVNKVWHFISEHADGLLYNSAFTKDRFNFRFPVAPPVQESVTHHSLVPEEYRDPRVEQLPEGDHILVFGNHYDHKAVAPTVELLSRAFPFNSIQAMGAQSQRHNNVTVVQSGHLPAVEIDRLIATARVVVFPSHYEGFGLPVVRALAYGRTVVVRSSSLWREIAGLMRMPGHLIEFVTPTALVEAVGQVLAAEQPDSMPLGGDLADEELPPSWRQCAQRLVRLVEKTLAGADAQRWTARDRALALAQP